MSNATLPQNYQSWPGGAVACNLETRRGSFGDSEVNPITNQPRNFYGSLDLVEKLIVIVKWLAIMNLDIYFILNLFDKAVMFPVLSKL